MQTPSEHLAEKIAEKLVAAGLFAQRERTRLTQKLAEGELKQDDWRIALENARETPPENPADA